ncbi:mRNA 3'-end-processing protein rna14 [Wickerhamomyces ciferrii]|uniref:mRNA 3'-end-processing protein RNA14 n=1 Tax=Wickerhamomyces ciferrii (strain ATCC 14091 / BCRC 22168 / CBS 111 / JCM 3599 / NBRC 0793 / NRRL Y-1031 F-60-10) TaxID=1206466 RepID=K0KX35_WICCF|nr:mRNA 3'-end-processing protein rna14 [Wickerhamomyces ciferrii]CCH46049.1 mRNA 3'-end-processing protein rna14 [Wickerhamomyces ciferrii]
MSSTPDVEPTPTPQPSTTNIPKRKKRLANDVIGQLQDHLKDYPLDFESWINLISKTQSKDKIDEVRSVYDEFLGRFPFRYQEWINYISFELQRDNFEQVENLFRKCLLRLQSIPVWKLYISYVFRKNNLITGGEDSRRNIFQAFDIALDKIGFDPQGLSIWLDYLKFINDWKPINSWDSQTKMDLKRKIYQKLLKLPIEGIELIWNDYNKFENELNSTTARKFISESSSGYMDSRSFLKEINNLTTGLQRNIEIPTKADPQQVKKWINWINWELQNKMNLSDDDLYVRLEYILMNSIQAQSFSIELWWKFLNFIQLKYGINNDKIDDVIKMSLGVLPGCITINFKILEIYELKNEVSLVGNGYEKLVKYYTNEFEKVELEIEEVKGELIGDDEEESKPEELKQELFKSNKEIIIKQKELTRLSKIITLINVEWFKSIKRLQGMKESRTIFSKARATRKTLTHHIFHQVALMESKMTSTKTSIKVFELGLKSTYFGNDGEYIYKYLKYLIDINDDNNLKTVFETTINSKELDSNWIKLIFKIMIKYELNFGNIQNVQKLKSKFSEKFPNEDDFTNFIKIYNDELPYNDDLIKLVDFPEEPEETKKRSIEEVIEDETDSNKRQQTQSTEQPQQQQPSQTISDSKQFVSDEVYNLLRVLPNSGVFKERLVDNEALIKLLSE